MSQNHRIIEWLELEGTTRIKFNLPCHRELPTTTSTTRSDCPGPQSVPIVLLQTACGYTALALLWAATTAPFLLLLNRQLRVKKKRIPELYDKSFP